MNGILILDGTGGSALSELVRSKAIEIAAAKGYEAETLEIGRDDLPPCIGCLDCITKHPGSCIYDAAVRPIAEKAANRRLVLLLASSSFGNPSSAAKNVMDRGMLIVKESCRQLVIGVGADASDEEASAFVDIVARHRGAAEIVHTRFRETIDAFFARRPEDCAAPIEFLARVL